jgi:formamidopyrimidine-DNA glycosylase
VSAADCRDARLTRPASARLFARTVVGKTVKGVARKGKWLRLELDDGARVFSHLGMTGDWARVAVGAPALRFERARIDVVRRGRASSVRYVEHAYGPYAIPSYSTPTPQGVQVFFTLSPANPYTVLLMTAELAAGR